MEQLHFIGGLFRATGLIVTRLPCFFSILIRKTQPEVEREKEFGAVLELSDCGIHEKKPLLGKINFRNLWKTVYYLHAGGHHVQHNSAPYW